MKIIDSFTLILFLSVFSCRAQINTLNTDELANISFNDIKLTQIRGIRGIDQNAEALFGKGNFESMENNYYNPNPNSLEDCPFYCMYYEFFDKNVFVRFEKFSSDDNYHFTYLKVKDQAIQVTVKDVTVSIGDNIDVFKGYNISENNHWVVFADEDTSTIDITFIFNPSTRKIIEIKMYTY